MKFAQELSMDGLTCKTGHRAYRCSKKSLSGKTIAIQIVIEYNAQCVCTNT